MFKKLFLPFSKGLGIDLGTANTLVYAKDRGIIINEPSLVAYNKKTNQVLAVGKEAQQMLGRTPDHIVVSRPLLGGVVSDFEVAEEMLRFFLKQAHHGLSRLLPQSTVVIGVPTCATEVEKRAVEDAVKSAGAQAVYLVEEPMAAAIGSRLPIKEPSGSLIVDIGGGTTEIALISLSGVVTFRSLKIAGDRLNQDISNFIRDEFGLCIGERSAEQAKIKIASAFKLKEKQKISLRGRDLASGLPKEIVFDSDQAHQAIVYSLRQIIQAIKEVIEKSPPELVADIMSQGIILTGGGSLLTGLDELITQESLVSAKLAEDPLTAVVRGTGIILEDLAAYKEVMVPMDELAVPK